jgi:hypothetical protein
LTKLTKALDLVGEPPQVPLTKWVGLMKQLNTLKPSREWQISKVLIKDAKKGKKISSLVYVGEALRSLLNIKNGKEFPSRREGWAPASYI